MQQTTRGVSTRAVTTAHHQGDRLFEQANPSAGQILAKHFLSTYGGDRVSSDDPRPPASRSLEEVVFLGVLR